jgi:hypothetical protein
LQHRFQAETNKRRSNIRASRREFPFLGLWRESVVQSSLHGMPYANRHQFSDHCWKAIDRIRWELVKCGVAAGAMFGDGRISRRR